MGGFFGAVSARDCVLDVFFGVDYHSHLGTSRGGMAILTEDSGFARFIHNIENTPFRTKFETEAAAAHGMAAIGCISDSDPQPLLIRSALGVYAICTIGRINNSEELAEKYTASGGSHFSACSGGRVNATELAAALIDSRGSFAEGIRYAQNMIDGSLSVLILTENGEIVAARDKLGRLPVILGRDKDGCCVSFESFAYHKLGYDDYYELGPGEIVSLDRFGMKQLAPRLDRMRICAFLWSYYGYPNSCYEGVNVEVMRCKNGAVMARRDRETGEAQDVDYVCGVPDSGVPHAIGYANESHIPFMRPFIKYTPTWPRSFMPQQQSVRDTVAKMKLIPVHELINGKKLLFVDDSIVRGTQLRETVEFLYSHGAEEVHMRSACPPIMYGCKYLNFSRSTSDMELIARRTISELEGEEGLSHIDEYSDAKTTRGKALCQRIAEKLRLTSLEFQSLDGLCEAIGIDKDRICTYCWNGEE